MRNAAPLRQNFYHAPVEIVARELLGKLLVRTISPGKSLVGRINETEAYSQDDPASHSFHGPTERNAPMFGPAGRGYVYRIYGIHHCFNAVTSGGGSAVLIRSVIPLYGLDRMTELRFPPAEKTLNTFRRKELTNGPGKLCQAFGIDLSFNNIPLDSEELFLGDDYWRPPPEEIQVTPRIGITKASQLLRRFLWRPGESIPS